MHPQSPILFLLAISLLLPAGSAAPPPQLKLRAATFQADATPFPGEPLIWVKPAKIVLDPLRAKGIIIEQGPDRYVMCSVDWCGIGGEWHHGLRTAMARAAHTSVDRVALHVIHQHTAPYADSDGYRILDAAHRPGLRLSNRFMATLTNRLSAAVRQGMKRLQPFDQVGTGQAKVDRVASMRRVMDSNGKLVTRWSTSGKDPKLAALPEGPVDPFIRTITLANNGKPLVRIHFYATHPQTFCCDGRVTADVVGAARDAVEKEDEVFQLYFTGAAGNVTMGKYNDSSEEVQRELAGRLKQGMEASIAATQLHPARPVSWRARAFDPPRKPMPALYWTTGQKPSDELDARTANAAAFAMRKRPLEIQYLDLGAARILMLPGEPMLEYQKYALSLAGDHFLAVAGYGEISPGYVCTDEAQREGGYEPGAGFTDIGTEQVLKDSIRAIME
ncbi:MAG: hypothetical protein IT160_09795 [Bryobacterales bacterium]|nr:hypothetical protein [Bryobacterales bacterium]